MANKKGKISREVINTNKETEKLLHCIGKHTHKQQNRDRRFFRKSYFQNGLFQIKKER